MAGAAVRDVWFKFFPSDWRGDEQLQACSLAARGLWIEMMCLAHKAGGYVRVNGHATSAAAIARQVRSEPRDVRPLLRELVKQGVCSVEADGTVYSRRMVRDAKRREINRENGSRGGNPNLKSGGKNSKPAFRLSKSVNPRSRSRSRSRSAPVHPPVGGWRDECAREHGGRCESATFHAAKMAEGDER